LQRIADPDCVQGLVDNVARLVTDSGPDGTALSSVQGRVQRELSALQKLVNASIVALRCVCGSPTLPAMHD
jgi:hypothetical protein